MGGSRQSDFMGVGPPALGALDHCESADEATSMELAGWRHSSPRSDLCHQVFEACWLIEAVQRGPRSAAEIMGGKVVATTVVGHRWYEWREREGRLKEGGSCSAGNTGLGLG